jgi:hypothetical protein
VIQRQSGGSPAGKPSRTLAVAATLAALPLLYLVLRTAAVSVSPAAATALPPTDASGLVKGLLLVTADPRQRVTPQTIELSRRAAVAAPLAYEPFFIQAKAEEQAGRIGNATRLMEEARRRRASFVLTRIHLIAYYQQLRRFPELLTEIDFVLRKSEEAKGLMLPELVKLIADADGRAALASILAGNPGWRSDFFDVARQQSGSPSDALALLNLVRERKPGGDISLERGLYLHRLVQAGDYSRARALWLASLPAQERPHHALLFNGAFRPIAAAAPFAWTFRQEAAGRAEMVSAGANTPYLDVLYFGGSNAIMAEQTLALAPGRYRLSQLAKSDEGIRSGEIYWSLSCLSNDAELARLNVANLRPAFRPSAIDFTVPAGCPGQRLRLMAQPGDIAAEVRAQLARLEVTRAN